MREEADYNDIKNHVSNMLMRGHETYIQSSYYIVPTQFPL